MGISSIFKSFGFFYISEQKVNDNMISIFKDYQIIEYCLKWIYSYKCKGNPNKNYKHIKDKTLGNIIKLLVESDYSDNDHWFSKYDCSYLKDMTKIRNYYIHRFFIDYLDAKHDYNKCNDLCTQLNKNKNEIAEMCENIVKIYNQIC
jgi:hypothetical protein